MSKAPAALPLLADPTRRAIVEALRDQPVAVGELARRTGVGRSAVSQHLQALKRADLVDFRQDGLQRVYALRPEALGELRRYIDDLWSDAFRALLRNEEPHD